MDEYTDEIRTLAGLIARLPEADQLLLASLRDLLESVPRPIQEEPDPMD